MKIADLQYQHQQGLCPNGSHDVGTPHGQFNPAELFSIVVRCLRDSSLHPIGGLRLANMEVNPKISIGPDLQRAWPPSDMHGDEAHDGRVVFTRGAWRDYGNDDAAGIGIWYGDQDVK